MGEGVAQEAGGARNAPPGPGAPRPFVVPGSHGIPFSVERRNPDSPPLRLSFPCGASLDGPGHGTSVVPLRVSDRDGKVSGFVRGTRPGWSPALRWRHRFCDQGSFRVEGARALARRHTMGEHRPPDRPQSFGRTGRLTQGRKRLRTVCCTAFPRLLPAHPETTASPCNPPITPGALPDTVQLPQGNAPKGSELPRHPAASDRTPSMSTPRPQPPTPRSPRRSQPLGH